MLKALFQQVLLAFRGSHKSVPFMDNYQATTLTYTRSGNGIQPLGSYTAPADGLFICQIELPTTDKAAAYVQVDNLDSNQTCCYNWGWPVLTLPIAKGKAIDIKLVATLQDGTVIKTYVRFYPYKGST